MAILLMILQILSALPTIIQLILAILKLINGLPKGVDKSMYRARLRDVLDNMRAKGRFTASHGELLENLYNDLKDAKA